MEHTLHRSIGQRDRWRKMVEVGERLGRDPVWARKQLAEIEAELAAHVRNWWKGKTP